MVVHAIAVVILSLFVVPLIQRDDKMIVVNVPLSQDVIESATSVELTEVPGADAGTLDRDGVANAAEKALEDLSELEEPPVIESPERYVAPEEPVVDSVKIEDFAKALPYSYVRSRRKKAAAEKKAAESAGVPDDFAFRYALSAEEAVDGLFADLEEDLAERDVQVVWLFDSSISLLGDRQRVAKRLEELLNDLKERSEDQEHVLTNAVIAFGRVAREVVPPTRRSSRVIDAIRTIPIDESGMENVLGAVGRAIDRYHEKLMRHPEPAKLKLVVWTDESGDDLLRLEPVIRRCREAEVQVSVAGPSAVLGREMGTHAWLHKPTKKTYWIPMKKGPDSAVPQRLRLPYWGETRLPNWAESTENDHLFSGLPPWVGGRQLEGLASGFGPYVLTRLAAATGGSYTIFDRRADRGPFVPAEMRQYRPDYRAMNVVGDSVKEHKLRQAIVNVVKLLSMVPDSVQPPEMSFFVKRRKALPATGKPDKITKYCLSPSRFRKNLEAKLSKHQEQVEVALRTINEALSEFGEDGMVEEYEREESARWRAWYDLTRGRLRAMSVRFREYRACCIAMRRAAAAGEGFFGSETNFIELEPSVTLKTGPSTEARAEEAERLLNRCLDQNLDTPWAYWAQRELDSDFGIRIEQQMLAAPTGGSCGAPPPTPGGGIPNLPNL